jgi:hypothetical protein
MGAPLNIMSKVFQGMNNSQEFFVVYLVISFSQL